MLARSFAMPSCLYIAAMLLPDRSRFSLSVITLSLCAISSNEIIYAMSNEAFSETGLFCTVISTPVVYCSIISSVYIPDMLISSLPAPPSLVCSGLSVSAFSVFAASGFFISASRPCILGISSAADIIPSTDSALKLIITPISAFISFSLLLLIWGCLPQSIRLLSAYP